MDHDTQDRAKVQRVINDLNAMVAQIVANHPRRAHIAADMAALVDEWLPFVEAKGWDVTATVLRSYRVYQNVLVPDEVPA